MATVKTNRRNIIVRKNSGLNVGTENRLNLIEGNNVSLTVTDDPSNGEIDVTIAATGGVTPVNPSIINDLVTFSDIIGGQKDSGYKISDLILGDGINKITVGTVAPVAPSVGDLWVDTN